MKFIDLVSKRESVRGYLEKKVEIEKIKKCVEAARLAPSACNAQPWTFVVVNEEEKLKQLRENIVDNNLGINQFVETAPVIVAIASQMAPVNPKSRLADVLKTDYTSIDIGIAAEHFCLQATELSLGTCIIGWFKEENIKCSLNIPSEKDVKLLISLGYPKNEDIKTKPRKAIDQIMRLNSYE